MKARFFTITLLLLLKMSFLKAQSPVFKEATLSHAAEFWKPVPLGLNGTNDLNGLQFYSFDSECDSRDVVFVKLINTNSYPVLLNYQADASKPAVTLIVPAQKTIEGNCSTSDPELKKLVLTIFQNKTPQEKEAVQNFIFSHMAVTKMQ